MTTLEEIKVHDENSISKTSPHIKDTNHVQHTLVLPENVEVRKLSVQSTDSKGSRKPSIEIGFKSSGRIQKMNHKIDYKYITEKIYDVEFNPAHFVYDWGYLLDIPSTRSLLKDVCEKASSSEGIEFLERVEQYQIMKSSYNRYEEACKIVNEFLQDAAEKEVNVPGTLKQIFFVAWSSNDRPMNGSYCPANLFDYFTNFIVLDLKDNFLNVLINDSKFQKWAKENPQLLKLCVLGVKTKQEILEDMKVDTTQRLSDQLLPCLNLPKAEKWITEKDLEMMRVYMTNYLKTEFWKKFRMEPGYTFSVSVSPTVFDNNNRPIHLLKETCVIPFKPNFIIWSLISKNSILFPTLEKIDLIDYFQIKETHSFACSICHLIFKSPFALFKQRDACLAFTLLSHDDGNIYLIIRSVNHPKVPETSSYIRSNIFFGICLEPYLESQTKVTYVHWADMNGSLLPSTINSLQRKKKNLVSKCITDYILGLEKELSEPEDSLRILNTYQDNNMQQKTKEESNSTTKPRKSILLN